MTNYLQLRKLFSNRLLHRYSFQHISNRQLLKTLWEKKKLLVTSNFFFSHNVFYSIGKLYSYLSIFLTSYLDFLLNWKSLKLACEIKGVKREKVKEHCERRDAGNDPFPFFFLTMAFKAIFLVKNLDFMVKG